MMLSYARTSRYAQQLQPLSRYLLSPVRCILITLVLVTLMGLCNLVHAATPAPSANSTQQRPNFLFIYTDDQRWDAMSVVQREHGEQARFPWFKTPHLDRLASEGVRFRNAFVCNALCSPSRAAFLTGRYNHLNGVANNHTPFPEQSVTWATELRKAGYLTAYVGKWHMGSQSGKRPGFDYSASFVGQGRYFDCPVEVNGVSTPSKGWIDDVSTDYAIDFLKQNKGKPWSLIVGFKSSHGPFQPPERAKERFAGEVARPVPNLGVPAIYNTGPNASRRNAPQRATANNGAVRPSNLNYFRCLSAVDDNLGRLLAALDDLGLADDTVLVYSSDNGYYLGEHGLGDKRSAYEESMRVPLLVRFPRLGVKGKVVDEMALNTDLAPTFLDLAGVPASQPMHGQSWRPLLEGKTSTNWRKALFYEYFYERGFNIPTVLAVRTQSAKLIKYPGHDEWTEVFDLKSDPYETKNLAGNTAHQPLRQQLEAEFTRQAQAVGFRIPEYADKPEGGTTVATKGENAVVLDYRFDKDEGGRVIDASGHNNHGTVRGTLLTEGRNGAKARRFDGKSSINVPKSRTINPAVQEWTLEVTFKSDAPDGILVAHGGASFGYCLSIEGGRPVFTVVGDNQTSQVTAPTIVTGQWTSVKAQITPRSIAIALNGAAPTRATLQTAITREPNNTLQIGDDLDSPVLGNKKPPPFTGLIETVRIYSGHMP